MQTKARPPAVEMLRGLALNGELAKTAARADPQLRSVLTGAAFEIATQVVFDRVTKPLERARGHFLCATSMSHLTEPCHDQFMDDVAAVVNDILTQADRPVRDLEAWVAVRAKSVVVDGYRRRRGERGALQRPRMSSWLASRLGDDRWLRELAIEILNWVGVPNTAGVDLWPLDAWAERRALSIGDPAANEPAAVARDIEKVLAVMRTRPQFFERYVERPLGRKQMPVVSLHDAADASLLLRDDRKEADDVALTELAATAIAAIGRRILAGEDPATVTAEILRTVFGTTSTDSMERPPLADPNYDELVDQLLLDEKAVNRIARTVIEIVQDTGGTPMQGEHHGLRIPAATGRNLAVSHRQPPQR
ncbi:hypothetical protein [Micromonospora sp. WMMD1219]|uniref:hypothetical protein n=1 Tax=Micromonospora sp. WMMD1219 TaxID=3404115 RepID=UPI003BF52788